MTVGDRCLAARTFLSSGYGLRMAIQSHPGGWTPFQEVADVSQPPRTKGIVVQPEYGVPFLIANQMFDIRPQVRKWLAVGHIAHADRLFAPAGTIVVRRSADVGRSTITCAYHEKHLISDHFFRVEPKRTRDKGWLYAFIRSPQARAMMVGAQYGHIIQHIEFSHLNALPVPIASDKIAEECNGKFERIVWLRNESHRLTLAAEKAFDLALGAPFKDISNQPHGFVRTLGALRNGRRRLDASFYSPRAEAVRRYLKQNGRGFSSVAESGYSVWLPNRFRRIPAADGIRFVDSSDLTQVNPDLPKRIADGNFGDKYNGRVEHGWILMARSGQTYGIIGTAVLATKALEGCVVSDHVMRIRPRKTTDIRPGYMLTALSHPVFGRPLVKSLAYGSSIPEIDVSDLANLQVVRLPPTVERDIDELARAAADARAEADLLELALTEFASQTIDHFVQAGIVR